MISEITMLALTTIFTLAALIVTASIAMIAILALRYGKNEVAEKSITALTGVARSLIKKTV